MNVHWTVPCEPSSVGDARWTLRSFLEEAGTSTDESDAAAMVITELLANAIVHAVRRSDLIEVAVESSDHQIHIEVTDHNPGRPVPREISLDAASGRGLTIVDALTSAWGWDPLEGDGKRVWGDVPRSRKPQGGPGAMVQVPGPASGPGRGFGPR